MSSLCGCGGSHRLSDDEVIDDLTYFRNKLEEAKKNNDEKLIIRYTNILKSFEDAIVIYKLYRDEKMAEEYEKFEESIKDNKLIEIKSARMDFEDFEPLVKVNLLFNVSTFVDIKAMYGEEELCKRIGKEFIKHMPKPDLPMTNKEGQWNETPF